MHAQQGHDIVVKGKLALQMGGHLRLENWIESRLSIENGAAVTKRK